MINVLIVLHETETVKLLKQVLSKVLAYVHKTRYSRAVILILFPTALHTIAFVSPFAI